MLSFTIAHCMLSYTTAHLFFGAFSLNFVRLFSAPIPIYVSPLSVVPSLQGLAAFTQGSHHENHDFRKLRDTLMQVAKDHGLDADQLIEQYCVDEEG
jgi:hypothetical protein